jgi:hypothetical protein
MKYETAKLSGAMLDAAVLMIEGVSFKLGKELSVDENSVRQVCFLTDAPPGCWPIASPSSRWSDGGPIIDREGLGLVRWPDGSWGSMRKDSPVGLTVQGDTPLVAAMRAFVQATMGDTVDL